MDSKLIELFKFHSYWWLIMQLTKKQNKITLYKKRLSVLILILSLIYLLHYHHWSQNAVPIRFNFMSWFFIVLKICCELYKYSLIRSELKKLFNLCAEFSLRYCTLFPLVMHSIIDKMSIDFVPTEITGGGFTYADQYENELASVRWFRTKMDGPIKWKYTSFSSPPDSWWLTSVVPNGNITWGFKNQIIDGSWVFRVGKWWRDVMHLDDGSFFFFFYHWTSRRGSRPLLARRALIVVF